MHLINTLRFVTNHPLNAGRSAKAFTQYIRWQVGSRLVPGPVVVPFVNDSRLIVKPGMTGATGNVYTGLQEYEDMAFVLHVLRPGDVFVDIGANIGSYTVLAGACAGASCVSFEPVPTTFQHLEDNVRINGLGRLCALHNVAVGRSSGTVQFTTAYDTVNHVVPDGETSANVTEVPVRRLDDVLTNIDAAVMKIDVEGFETEVIAGAQAVLQSTSLFAVIMELNGSGLRYGFDENAIHRTMLACRFRPYRYLPDKRFLFPLEGKNEASGNSLYLRDFAKVAERVRTAPMFRVNEKEL